MPASVILTAIYGSIAAATAAIGAFGVAAATFAINFAISAIVSRVFISRPDAPQDTGSRQQMPPSSDNPIPIAYGDAWLGGKFIDAVLSVDQKTMYYVMAISHVSPDGLFTFDTSNFYYGDRKVTFDGTDLTKAVSLTDGAGNVDTKIADDLYVWLYRSTAAGVITPLNSASMPSTVMGGSDIDVAQRWTGTRQMNGLAFAIVKLNYNRNDEVTSLSPLTFKVNHYLNGAGAARPGDVFRDYLNSSVYGGAVLLSNINTTSCNDLNTYSDALITYTPSGGGSATQARYRINGVIDTGEQILSNVNKIMMSCDSWMAYEAATGQWAVVINKDNANSFDFNDSNIIGDIRVSVTDLSSSINQIEASFPFKGNKDQPEYIRLQTPVGLLYSNEPVNKLNTSFDLVNDSVQAGYLANRLLEQAREDLIVSFATAYPGIQVNAGDVVSVTNASYGWSSKLFRVLKIQEASLPDGGLGASLELSEYNAAVYDDFSITQFAPTPNSNLVSGSYFSTLPAPVVGDINLTISVPTFSVTCQIPSSGRVNSIVLFYTTSATPTELDWKVWGSQTNSSGGAYSPSASIKFPDISLPGNSYYFAFKVFNDTSSSNLSSSSSVHNWVGIVKQAQTGTAAVSGTTMTGSGIAINPSGVFSIGSSAGNITYNGSSVYLNGAVKSDRLNIADGYGTSRGNVDIMGTDNLMQINKTNSTLLPAVYLFDNSTGGTSSPSFHVLNTSLAPSTGVVYFASQAAGGIALYVQSSGSGSGAAKFYNTNASKNVWLAPGGYSVYSAAGGGQSYIGDGYLPFTGQHQALISKDAVFDIGDIVYDVAVVYKQDINNVMFQVAVSQSANQCSIGVVSCTCPVDDFSILPAGMWEALADANNFVTVNAVGEGQINVCGEGGNIQPGDLIVTSSTAGKGMKQSDNIVRNVTIAKARESASFGSATEQQQIACIYLCG